MFKDDVFSLKLGEHITLTDIGEDFLHPVEISVFPRREDEKKEGILINLLTGKLGRSTLENPSPRRQGISIKFRHESDNETFRRLDIWQHKGKTLFTWNKCSAID